MTKSKLELLKCIFFEVVVLFVAFSPVLSSQDYDAGNNGTQDHVLDKLDLGSQGDGGHGALHS